MTIPIAYADIFPPDYSVTGIRSKNANNTQVILTGSCPPSSNITNGMIYSGPVNPIDPLGISCVLPKHLGAITAVFYGPDTPLFNPSIGEENIRVVGTYRRSGENYDHGVLYKGPPDGSGEDWKPIDMPDGVAGGKVINTIPHSTMGELIVGNYEYKDMVTGLDGFGAFIYDINNPGENQYRRLTLEPYKLITAYGIWQNEIGSTSYTIAGGLADGSGFNVGYLVDYNSETFQTSNLTTFVFDNTNRNLITHFEGITKYGEAMTDFGPRYYSLAATGDQDYANRGAAFAVVERLLPDGLFGDLVWERVKDPNSIGINTGNTVLTNNLFGIYETVDPNGKKGIQSYMAIIPPQQA